MGKQESLPMKPDAAPPAVVPHPLVLIQAMVDKGMDVSDLKALSELAVIHEDRNARKEFFDALARVQAQFPQFPKSKHVKIVTKTGAVIEYDYSPLDVIDPVTKPLCNAEGLSYGWMSRVTEDGRLMTTRCTLRHANGHEEYSEFTCPTDSPNPKMSGQQKFAGAQTFARRITLTSVLGIVTTDPDIDGLAGDRQDVTSTPTITAEQALDIQTRAESLWGADKMGEFLRFCHAPTWDAIPASRYEVIVEAIREEEGA